MNDPTIKQKSDNEIVREALELYFGASDYIGKDWRDEQSAYDARRAQEILEKMEGRNG